jgi:hypothetical protein
MGMKTKKTISIVVQLCSSCQITTQLFLIKHLGISSVKYSSGQSINPQVFKEKNPLDLSLLPYHIHTYHFLAIFLTPRALFWFPRHHGPYHSQELEARFNTLQSNFTETQQEMRQLSANIATINKNMYSYIPSLIEELKQDLKQEITAQLESVTLMICTKLHIPTDPPFFDPPFHNEAETSSNSHNFQSHHF